jgi:hypothetical protein
MKIIIEPLDAFNQGLSREEFNAMGGYEAEADTYGLALYRIEKKINEIITHINSQKE